MRRRHGNPRRQGYALMAAILLMFIVSFVAVGTQTVVRDRVQRVLAERHSQRARWAADSGIRFVLANLQSGVPADQLAESTGSLERARYVATLKPAQPDLVAALLPGQATQGVMLIASRGEALAKDDKQLGAIRRVQALVRGTGGKTRTLLYIPGVAEEAKQGT